MKKTLFLLLLCCYSLQAHSLKVFVTQESDTFIVYSYFSKSSPCKGCQVTLFDEQGNLFDEGITDASGKSYFKAKKQKFRVIVKASMGHQGESEFSSQNPVSQEEGTLNIFLKGLFAFGVITIFFLFAYFVKRKRD